MGRESYDRKVTFENVITWVYDGQSFTPVAKVTEQERYTIVHDYLGTPTQAYDSKGKLVWEMLLDVYGNAKEYAGEKCFVPFRYQGQYEDRETGLYYNRFRYYDPKTGIYLSQDPIGLQGGSRLYGYVRDINSWVDILGLSGFFTPTVFNAPSGNTHTVYQQNIDWDLPVNTRDGIKTNLELAQQGKTPFVVKDGVYCQINLHHSKQNAKDSLFELSAVTHQRYYGSNALHPHLPNAHPDNPVNRDLFNLDREEYWRQRAATEINARKKGCH